MMNFRSSPLIYRAFTLIELLIVIVIIGILATAFIPKITGMQDRARYARVEKDFRDFRAAVFLAQSNTNKILSDITGRGCTMCDCGFSATGYISFEGVNMKQVASGSICRTTRITSLRKIEQAAGMSTGSLSGLETDPWGSPYLLDENEGEFSATPCRMDFISSAGSNGLWKQHNVSSESDDKLLNIPGYGCPGAY